MKLNSNNKQNILSNNSKDSAMSFDIGDVSVIIDILRNRLYSNPIQTLTQEYLSNGRDATRESGSDRPLRVTLPTGLDSVLKIRDYGVGLSPERVKEVFVLYGASTKRDSNSQTGGFGIGAKSAWSYTDSFTVISYYNGVSYTYIAHTGDNSNGTFEKLAEEKTSEPNGVEIQIPVKQEDREKFINAVYRSTLFWEVRPEFQGITSSEIPEDYTNFLKNVTHKDSSWKILKNSDFYAKVLGFSHGMYYPQMILSVDGIPYPLSKFYNEDISKKILSSYGSNQFLVLELKNGEVEVSANREEVSDKKDTKEKLELKLKEVYSELKKYIEDKIKEPVGSLVEYISNYNSMVQGFSREFWPIFHYKASNEMIFSASNFRSLIKPETLLMRTHRYSMRVVRSGNTQLTTEESTVDLNRENLHFILRDTDDSLNKTREKIRSYFESLTGKKGDHAVYLIEDYNTDQSDFIKKEFKVKLLSDLSYEKKQGTAKKRSTDKITARFLTYEGDRTWNREYIVRTQEDVSFDGLNADSKKYILVPFSSSEEYSKDNSCFLQNIRFLHTFGGYTILKLSNRDYRLALENLDNVLEYSKVSKDIEKTVTIPEASIQAIKERVMYRSVLSVFKPYSKKIKDKNFVNFVENVIGYDHVFTGTDQDIPSFILDKYEWYVSFKDQNAKRMAEEDVFLTKYKILRRLDLRKCDEEEKGQVIDFINFLNKKK